MSVATGSVTEVRERHTYDRKTGFCTVCGLHREMADADDLLCVTGENVVAISHLRARQIEDAILAKAINLLK